MSRNVIVLYVLSFDAFTDLALLCAGVTLDADFGPNSVFHSPSKETILTSTTTFGPKPFVFIPQQVRCLSSACISFTPLCVCVCVCVSSAYPRNHPWSRRPWFPPRLHPPLSWQASGTSVPSRGQGGTGGSLFLLTNQGEGNKANV